MQLAEKNIDVDRLLSAKAIVGKKDKKPSTTITLNFVDQPINDRFILNTSNVETIDGFSLKVDNENSFIGFEKCLLLEFLRNGNSRIELNVEGNELSQKLIDQFLVIALDYAVANNSQSLCHAACILTPDKKSVILIYAPSGSGKTTTSLALTQLGYSIISDDACGIYCEKNKKDAMAWGIPRAAKVHKNTIAFLGSLKAFTIDKNWDVFDEQLLNRQAMINAGYMSDAELMPVQAIIALDNDISKPALIEDLPKFDTITALLEDNFVALDGKVFPSHNNRLQVFGELVKRTKSFKININDKPCKIAKLIDQAMVKLIN